MSNLFEHCRTGVSSASQRYEKPEAMQINLLFAEAKYSRCSQSAISLCQSAAGGGCAGGRRRSDAALCMSGCGLPLFGCGRRANLSKLYFSRPPACGIALRKERKDSYAPLHSVRNDKSCHPQEEVQTNSDTGIAPCIAPQTAEKKAVSDRFSAHLPENRKIIRNFAGQSINCRARI